MAKATYYYRQFDEFQYKRTSGALTDNNYQSTQSFSIDILFYWLKIGKIGNYCQLKAARCLSLSIRRTDVIIN